MKTSWKLEYGSIRSQKKETQYPRKVMLFWLSHFEHFNYSYDWSINMLLIVEYVYNEKEDKSFKFSESEI